MGAEESPSGLGERDRPWAANLRTRPAHSQGLVRALLELC
eukprot:CAMPEP_0172196166 /NCGR_PEP_ID=MMETSP1050-20130122/26654_1 /TAXON_ID=233186 /ORGANISM="Cryptomonas curvata, Strain CCAP979/52" /LENGTH=39 /DNA_ID= /DNA_START= /DNA_END= /DNA_ORIENTATION=